MNGSSVLIIDTRDAAYIRDLQMVYNIETAESASAAIEKMERSSFDAAIVNIDLIGMNSLSTIKKLCLEAVLIAISSEGSTFSLQQSRSRIIEVMRLGFYDYVFSPFPSDYLISSIDSGVRASLVAREKAGDLAAVTTEKGSISAIIQSMPEGLIVTDRSQRVVFCNLRAAELLGRKAAVFGLPISELIGQPVELGGVKTPELKLEVSAGTVLMRTSLILDAGDSLNGRIAIRPYASGVQRQASRTGKILGWISVLTDVTELTIKERLTSEAALRCTHEIRAPLGAIRNYLTVLLDGTVGNLNDKQRFMLKRMIMRVEALLELERDLLDLSSIESGRGVLPYAPTMEPLSLADSVREITDMMRPSAAEKGVRMRLLIEPEPLVARADTGAVKRVFTNLVSNAIKYTASGGIVQIRAGRADTTTAFVEVMDTGIGISADNLPHVFDKFFRVRNRHTAAIVGTGLGLPIVKALVRDMQGEIKVDSEVGRGSTFTVFLPIAETTVFLCSKAEVHERESKVVDSEKYVLLSNLDTNFKDEISREPGGENIKHCFSCGTCVAACPVRWINEKYNPRKIIRMALLGMRKQVLESEFIWFCSTCYTCHERCPQEVRITEIMNVLKNMASREGYAHPAYVRQANTIRSLGRLYEVDQFDNRKRERLGLPEISTDPHEVSQIFEITGISELIRTGES